MVPWKGALTPAQIDDVVAYVRSMAVSPGVPVLPPRAVPPGAPLPPRRGPIVLHPRGRAPDFVLKEGLYVSIDQVKEALDRKRRIVITDARAPSDWLNLRIAGAISTPYYDTRSLDDIPNDGTWVVAYCACPHHVSGEVVAELRKRGYKHTAVIDEGVFAWQQKGYPVVAAPGSLPPPAPPPMRPLSGPPRSASRDRTTWCRRPGRPRPLPARRRRRPRRATKGWRGRDARSARRSRAGRRQNHPQRRRHPRAAAGAAAA